MNILSIGEILWDILPDGEYLGGAPFNFAAHAARLGHNVFFVSAVGDDVRGRAALTRMAALGLTTRFVRVDPGNATGAVSVTLQDNGQPRFVIHRPAAYDAPSLDHEQFQALATHPLDWIYFGTLNQTSPAARSLTLDLIRSFPRARRFYDVNLRPNSWTPQLVEDLCDQATLVKLNEGEARLLGRQFNLPTGDLHTFCDAARNRYGWDGVCITRAEAGCILHLGSQAVTVPGYPVAVEDAVGAGDAFSAALVHGLGAGWPAAAIGDFANRLGALVASRRGAIPDWTLDECRQLSRLQSL